MSNDTNASNYKDLADYSYRLGQHSKTLEPASIQRDITHAQVAIIPDGTHMEDLKPYIPARPERIVACYKMFEPRSFIQYVNEHKSEHSRIFAQIFKNPYSFEAIIDFHETSSKGSADWCNHRVILEMRLSEQFNVWKDKDGDFFRQSDFAEFLKDNRLDILTPAHADILQLVMDLEATSECRYNSKLPTNQGTTLSFTESVNTMSGGKQVPVPEKIILKLPLFQGVDAFEIECDFKFRAKDGNLYFGYRMIGIEKTIRDTIKSTAKLLEQETNLPVFI